MFADITPPAPEARSLGVASDVDAPLSECPFGDTFFFEPTKVVASFHLSHVKKKVLFRRHAPLKNARASRTIYSVNYKGTSMAACF
jgi:hypothetical protein